MVRVIDKIGRPRSESLICLITSIITDRIGRHEVLFPINHNYNKICEICSFVKNIKTQEITRVFSRSGKKVIVVRVSDGAHCPIT